MHMVSYLCIKAISHSIPLLVELPPLMEPSKTDLTLICCLKGLQRLYWDGGLMWEITVNVKHHLSQAWQHSQRQKKLPDSEKRSWNLQTRRDWSDIYLEGSLLKSKASGYFIGFSCL